MSRTIDVQNLARSQLRRAAFNRWSRRLMWPAIAAGCAMSWYLTWSSQRVVGARRLDDGRLELIVEQRGRIQIQVRAEP